MQLELLLLADKVAIDADAGGGYTGADAVLLLGQCLAGTGQFGVHIQSSVYHIEQSLASLFTLD